jgi:hypothetical protein
MTTIIRNSTLILAAVLGLAATRTAEANHGHLYSRIDRLAIAIEEESGQLYQELRSVALHDLNLRTAAREVADLNRLAHRLHDNIHFGRDLRSVHRDVRTMEDLVHHIEDHLRGHRHFRKHVDRIDSLAHQLHDAVDQLRDREFARGPIHYRPAYSTQQQGIMIGTGGFSVRIGR